MYDKDSGKSHGGRQGGTAVKGTRCLVSRGMKSWVERADNLGGSDFWMLNLGPLGTLRGDGVKCRVGGGWTADCLARKGTWTGHGTENTEMSYDETAILVLPTRITIEKHSEPNS